MPESSQEKLSRRSFLKFLGLGTAAFLAGRIADKKEGGNLETFRPNESIFTTSKIELKASPIPGIADIIDPKTQRLVNNLVLLVSWQDASGIHYNNSEIQAAPILFSPEDKSKLIFRFEKEELLPARQPASGLTVELQLSNKDGDIAIIPHIQKNPNHLGGAKIGIGCFFGINQGVSNAEILGAGQVQTILPNANSDTGFGQLGVFQIFEGSRGFTLHSAFPDIPSLSLATANNQGRVDIESRNVPYKQEHQGLHENYIRQARRREWIEAGILYAPPGETFILSLGDDKLE